MVVVVLAVFVLFAASDDNFSIKPVENNEPKNVKIYRFRVFTKKETKKKKTGQQKTRRRGVVVATFFNRSRTLYVKGKRVPAGLFFSPSSAGENGGALPSPLSLSGEFRGASSCLFISLSFSL